MYHHHSTIQKNRLDYLQSMLGQLKIMADSEGFDMLAYLIEMAQIEARDMMRSKQAKPERPE